MVVIDREKCVGCGLCVSDCCASNLVIDDGKAAAKHPSCIQCGHCVAICPQGAVSIPEYDMADLEPVLCGGITPEAMLRSIKSRRSIRAYYRSASFGRIGKSRGAACAEHLSCILEYCPAIAEHIIVKRPSDDLIEQFFVKLHIIPPK